MSGTKQLAQYQAFLNLDAPIANPDLTVSIPWYQFFLTLWQRSGGSTTPTQAINLTNLTPGGITSPQTLVASPHLFVAPQVGQVLVTRKFSVVEATGVRKFERGGETVEFSRDGNNYYLIGSAPSILTAQFGDSVRVSWFTSDPPIMIFFPSAGGQ